MRELVEKTIESLRRRLLDLTNRNRLLNYKHSERSRTHIRIIDELSNVLYGRLEDSASLTFKALPEPEDEPKDEHSDRFLMSLEEARLADEEYIKEILELGIADDGSTKKARKIERRMKDRLRERLGMSPRKSLEVLSITEYAQQHGFNSNYDMPCPMGLGDIPLTVEIG